MLGVMLRAGDVQIGIRQDDWKKRPAREGRGGINGVGTRLFVSTTQDIDQLAGARRRPVLSLDAEPHAAERHPPG